MTNNAVQNKERSFLRGITQISQLIFADDLLLPSEASVDQLKVVKSCLEDFDRASGQKVSLVEARTTYSKNVSNSPSEASKDWNYPLIELSLPEKIVSYILAMAAPQEEGGQDVLIWGLTNQGQYSTMSRLNFQMGRSMRNDLNSRINLEIEGITKDQSVFMDDFGQKARGIGAQLLEFHAGYYGNGGIQEYSMMSSYILLICSLLNSLPSGWLRLNTEHAAKGNPGTEFLGRRIRDGEQKLVERFRSHMRYCYASEADLWAILKGLSRACELGYRKVVVELDYKIVLGLLTGESTNTGG
ncbi:hypothetical protein NL676_013598 [Syzygium grande]|nr:hypothetical protein NL676_013598 [Syzygium grande]